jgi:glycosyltransferase involved in cell wall biosynthesis
MSETSSCQMTLNVIRKNWVSVVIPTFNRSRLVIRSMESVLGQTYRPIELIVIDDGSIDDTSERLDKWKREHERPNDFEVCTLRQQNRGAPAARNHGLGYSIGEYVQFLDSDCTMLSEKLRRQVAVLRNSRSDYCSCIVHFVDEAGRVKYVDGAAPATDLLLEAVSFRLNCNAPLWRRTAIADIVWDEDLPCQQDWFFKLRVILNGAIGEFLPEVLAQPLLHEGERISRHDSVDFLVGREKAILRAYSLIKGLDNNAHALNCLSGLFLSMFKAYLRLHEFDRAQAALNHCMAIAQDKTVKMKFIWGLNACFGPQRLWHLLRMIKRV